MEDKLQWMRERVDLLNEASKAYYQEDLELMSNIEFDKLYDELLDIEKETGIVLSNSPTIHVGYELVSNLPKERHEKVMLSLDKTKDISALKEWLSDEEGILSWKLDGLTIVLTYEEGRLQKAVTRGNGELWVINKLYIKLCKFKRIICRNTYLLVRQLYIKKECIYPIRIV